MGIAGLHPFYGISESLSQISVARLYRSVHIHAAVDTDRLAGHEAAVVGGKEDHRAD